MEFTELHGALYRRADAGSGPSYSGSVTVQGKEYEIVGRNMRGASGHYIALCLFERSRPSLSATIPDSMPRKPTYGAPERLPYADNDLPEADD